ncbi:hypothetical protein MUB04_15765 [Acinetobacter indicus]|uniref:hypothetical protein n=1 Tax=Acinetobacter TaxID=469 RepID=UPI0015D1989E|nr:MULTISPECIES: hypothetical protein [Acinetobacter]MCP0917995.1 hypothetical protein [Acinetobacter indicus]
MTNQKTHSGTGCVWSSLVYFRDNCRESTLVDHADMLLRQLNTAAGSHMLKQEAQSFLDQNRI